MHRLKLFIDDANLVDNYIYHVDKYRHSHRSVEGFNKVIRVVRTVKCIFYVVEGFVDSIFEDREISNGCSIVFNGSKVELKVENARRFDIVERRDVMYVDP